MRANTRAKAKTVEIQISLRYHSIPLTQESQFIRGRDPNLLAKSMLIKCKAQKPSQLNRIPNKDQEIDLSRSVLSPAILNHKNRKLINIKGWHQKFQKIKIIAN